MARFSITANGDDITTIVSPRTIKMSGQVGQRSTNLSFSLQIVGDETSGVNVDDEVVLSYGGRVFFRGLCVRDPVEYQQSGKIAIHTIYCLDYATLLRRINVNERFTETTIASIITELIAQVDGVGVAEVPSGIDIGVAVFAQEPVDQCIEKLVSPHGLTWYVDSDKMLHVVKKGSEVNDKTVDENVVIRDTLKYRKDGTQRKNNIRIRGDNVDGEKRTERFVGNGNTRTFTTSLTMNRIPVVRLNGTQQLVAPFEDGRTGIQVIWNQDASTIEFKATPPNGARIEVDYIPQVPVLIDTAGGGGIRFDYFDRIEGITTTADARAVANAILADYQGVLIEGSFNTYSNAYRAGETININMGGLDEDDDYLIQSTSTAYHGGTNKNDDVLFATQVSFANVYDILLEDKIRDLLKRKDIEINADQVIERLRVFRESMVVKDKVEYGRRRPVYKYSGDKVVPLARAIFDYSTWS